MLKERTMIFVWRCPECCGVYEGQSVFFLHSDGEHRYCPCGGRLEEGVAPEGEWHYRLTIPQYLQGTSLHRRLEDLLADKESVEVTSGRWEDRCVSLFSC